MGAAAVPRAAGVREIHVGRSRQGTVTQGERLAGRGRFPGPAQAA